MRTAAGAVAVGLGHWSSCSLPLSDMGWPTPEFCCFPTGAAPPLANPRLPLAVFPRVGHLPLFLPSVWLPRSLVALPPKLPSGATATIVNDACMTPWDVVKQRMQVSHSPYRNIFHCAKSTYRHEGLSAFYRSYWTTVGGWFSSWDALPWSPGLGAVVEIQIATPCMGAGAAWQWSDD